MTGSPSSAPRWGRPGAFALLGVLWVLPLWAVRYLPMLDYPQQLAAASILRYYNDPARGLAAVFERVPWRPQGLFEILTAGLAWIMPLETAGKLVLSLATVAVLPAAVALCRRAGRPDWYALLALALTYSSPFYWGFVDNLLAYPLVLAGMAAADRRFDPSFDRLWGAPSWLLLAGVGLLFYCIHLEFLLVYAGAVGWLALARRPGLRKLALWLSTLVPGLALGTAVLGWAHLHAAEVMTGYQERLQSEPAWWNSPAVKIGSLPSQLFGWSSDGTQLLLAGLLLAILGLLAVRGSASRRETPEAGDLLFRTRFAVPALGLLALYLVLPEFARGYMVAERLVAMAGMMAVPALPVPPAPRRRLAALLTAGLLAVHLGHTLVSFLRFSAQTAGLAELLEETEPGQSLAGLVYQGSGEWIRPNVLVHFPAYYQVARGGRLHFSFVQFFNSPVRFRPGQNWEDDLLAEWDEWNPQRFVYPRHAGPFRYFLLYGSQPHLAAAFGPYLQETRVRQAGSWFLIERLPRSR